MIKTLYHIKKMVITLMLASKLDNDDNSLVIIILFE